MANLTISSVVVGGLRTHALTKVDYQGDAILGIDTELMWAVAQISTGTIVACCPYLRRLLEILEPRNLFRNHHRASLFPRPKQSSILVTTTIDVHGNPPSLPTPASVPNDYISPEAPTFEVERGPVTNLDVERTNKAGPSRRE